MKHMGLHKILALFLQFICFTILAQSSIDNDLINKVDLEVETRGFASNDQNQVRLKLFNLTSQPLKLNATLTHFVVTAYDENSNEMLAKQNISIKKSHLPAFGKAVSSWVDFPSEKLGNAYLTAQLISRYTAKSAQANDKSLMRRTALQRHSVSYIGQLDTISPQQANDATPIVISGKAIDIKTKRAVPYVGLDVVLTINQFEKKRRVVTDENGSFTYIFEHHAGESGDYEVSVINPTTNERPAQGHFTIQHRVIATRQIETQAALKFIKQSLTTATDKGEAITEKITLKNTANVGANNVTASISSPQNLKWAKIISAKAQPVLAKKASWEISLNFSPATTLTEGSYPFLLTVTADNADEAVLPITVAITSDEKGDFTFRIEDIYTNYNGENGNDGVTDASVTLTNETVKSFSVSQKTNQSGRLTFKDLPTGIYRYRASAPDHNPKSGEIWVRPGIEGEQKVFLDKELVKVEWRVTEVTIEDEYDIIIDMTYETDVPAPVIVMDPPIVKLPALKKGEVFKGELKITNYGLVKTTDVKTQLPQSDDQIQYDFLEESVPDVLLPMQTVYLPYRATAKKQLGFDPKYIPLLTEKKGLFMKKNSPQGKSCLTEVPFFYDVPVELSGTFECANGDENEANGESRFDFSGKPYPFLGLCEERAVCMTSVLGWAAVPTFCNGGGGGGGGGGGAGAGGGAFRDMFPGMSDCRPEVANQCDQRGGGAGGQ